MAKTRRRHAGVKNATLKAEKEALKAQKKAEAQILKDVKAEKAKEKAKERIIKEEKKQILKEIRAILKDIRARKKEEKAQPKQLSEAEAKKFEKLAMELFKKNSKMKAEAKEWLYKMGRDHKDKENIDIMLENMWYDLDTNAMAVWINKVRAKN